MDMRRKFLPDRVYAPPINTPTPSEDYVAAQKRRIKKFRRTINRLRKTIKYPKLKKFFAALDHEISTWSGSHSEFRATIAAWTRELSFSRKCVDIIKDYADALWELRFTPTTR